MHAYMDVCVYSALVTAQRYRTAVAGASGYSGGELLRLVESHPSLELTAAAAGSKAGQRLAAVHPQLTALGDIELQPTTAEVLGQADVVFLALPHGESAALVRELAGVPLIVDLGADFRLADAGDWEHYYGGEHAGSWVYGLPEMQGSRDQIAGSKRIANPGCYATAITLSLAPLLAAGLIEPDDIVVVAASGTSGAGRKAAEALLASEVAGSMSAYKVGGVHQHTPEVEQALTAAAGQPASLLFTPLLAPMSRGILATATARTTGGADAAAVAQCLRAAYRDTPFVHVLPDGRWPATASVYGSNSVHLQATVDPRTGRATVVAALDNLVKGAAGQAIQNANISLGLDETAGLPVLGVAP